LGKDDLSRLKKIEKRSVLEYGPGDLDDPDGRVLFVSMLCRPLIHLMEESKFGQEIKLEKAENGKKINSKRGKDDREREKRAKDAGEMDKGRKRR
jgi:hypothetical protein